MTLSVPRISRRQVLMRIGFGGAALMLPRATFAQAEMQYRTILPSTSPSLQEAPSYLAEALGYYKEEGIEVERIPSNTGSLSLTTLLSGAGESLLSVPLEFLIALSRGQKLKILSASSSYYPYYFIVSKAFAQQHQLTEDTPLDKRRAAVSTFKGIRVGISSPGSGTDIVTRALLREAGLSPEEDARLIPLGSTVNSLAAMSSGGIDAFVATPPIPEFAYFQQGAVRLFGVGRDDLAGLRSAAGSGMMVRARDVEGNPNLFAAAVRADVKAMRHIIDDPEHAGATLYEARLSKTIPADVWPTVWESNKAQFRSPYVTKDSVAAWITKGLIANVTDPNVVDLDSAVDMRFVDQAVKDIGWNIAP